MAMDVNDTMPETTEQQKHERLMQWRVWGSVTALAAIRPTMPTDEWMQESIGEEVIQHRVWVSSVEKLLGLPAGRLTDSELRAALGVALGNKSVAPR